MTAIFVPRGPASPKMHVSDLFDQDTVDKPDGTLFAPGATLASGEVTRPLPIVRLASLERTGSVASYRLPASLKYRAPIVLRVSVAMVLVVSLASVGGALYARGHPKWLIGLRNIASSVLPAKTTTTSPPRALGRSVLVSSTSTAVVYHLPTSSYSIVVRIDHPTWIVVHSPAGSTSALVEETLLPSAGPLSIAMHASSSITVAARTQSITITSGASALDTIDEPIVGTVYTFESERTAK